MQKEVVNFIPLYYDFMFKKVFTENPNLLKRFLITVLDLDLNPDRSTINILNSDLPKSKLNEYNKTVDIVVSINNNNIINVELNGESYKSIKDRNLLYQNKIQTLFIETGTKYNDFSNYFFYQLNLNFGKSNYFKDKNFEMMDKDSGEKLSENFKILFKSLDYYSNLYYNKKEKVSIDILWLVLINSKDYEELENISRLIMNKKEQDKFIKDVKDGSMDGFNIHEWEKEKMDALVRQKAKEEMEEEKRIALEEKRIALEEMEEEKKIAVEEATKLGLKKGIEQGIEQGIDQRNIEITKNLIQLNIPNNDISKATGLSLEEIEEIKNLSRL